VREPAADRGPARLGRRAQWALAGALLAAVVACKKQEPAPAPALASPAPEAAAPAPAWEPPPPVPATACRSNADCPEGAICEGEGCGDDAPGTCVGMRPCTRDLRQYCGCDGVTFGASGTCPGRRYAHRGPCP
jgi:hypothetical protein